MKKTICVYCASSTKVNQRYYDAAVELGELIAQKGMRLINGAGTMGLMRACADAVLNNGGKAVDYTEKIEMTEAAPEFPAEIPTAEVPAN